MTDFSYVGMGDYAELAKEVDFDFKTRKGWLPMRMWCRCLSWVSSMRYGREFPHLPVAGIYAITVAPE